MAPREHTYRSDIDGLRAIAVVSVVLFHAGLQGFGGGFVGVDIFFVISGFLITSILMEDLQTGRFSIARFYERRIRRIFPALFVMLAVAGILAAILVLPDDFAEFGSSLSAATLFVSNIFFWQSSDYFSGPAHLKPLLHTWSLSVEEQFYIVFPLLLLAIYRWGRGAYRSWLVLFLLGSYAASVWGMTEKPVANFYLAPPRAWELLIGALIAVRAVPTIENRWIREMLGAIGLGLIAWTVFTYSKITPFPGSGALPPCLGAALIIYAGQGSPTLTSCLLGLRPMVWLGLISYSLYLWHWPVLVFARHWNGSVLTGAQTMDFLLISLVLAWASWKYVEQPFRARSWSMSRNDLFRATGGVMACAAALGYLARYSEGWPDRFPDYKRPEIAGFAALKVRQCFMNWDQGPWNYAGLTRCSGGSEAARSVLVWGDSFGAHLVPGLQKLAGPDLDISQYTAAGCPPVRGLDVADRPHCRAFNDHAMRVVEELSPDIVVLVARWESYMGRLKGMDGLQATVDELNELGIKVVLMGQSPAFDFRNPYDFVFQKKLTKARVIFDYDVNETLAAVKGVTFFDPMPLLCTGLTCDVSDAKDYLYFDDAHLSAEGSAKVAAVLLPLLARTIIESAPDFETVAEHRTSSSPN